MPKLCGPCCKLGLATLGGKAFQQLRSMDAAAQKTVLSGCDQTHLGHDFNQRINGKEEEGSAADPRPAEGGQVFQAEQVMMS